MAEDGKPTLFQRFAMFLTRALGASEDPKHSSPEKFRADMYNSTDGGGFG